MSCADWDDLFALAEGRDVKSSSSSGVGTNQAGDGKRKTSEAAFAVSASQRASSNKKKRARSGNASEKSRESFLANRTSNSIQLPQEIVFGSSLMGDDTCSRAKYSKNSPTKTCKRCGESRFRHVIRPTQAESTSYQLNLFCLLRNMRHCYFLRIKEDNQDWIFASILTAALKLLPKLKRQCSFLDQHAPRLQSKICSLIKRLSGHRKAASINVEETVRAIMDCDAAYYELYYAEITVSKHGSFCIPHPVSYFGEFLEELGSATVYVEENASVKNDSLLRQRFSLDCHVENEDPLTLIHHVRFLEAVQLFHLSGWLSKKKEREAEFSRAARAPMASDPYDIHETPAPSVLCAWRDSSRDFMTHLYAYATLPRSIIEQIQEFVGQERIVEVGAGTGYLAQLLQRQGVVVDAFDCRPGKQNEYHGSTPTFLPIAAMDSSTVIENEHQTFVLLLCYPPPDSSMAVDTLRAFLKHGGKRVVYVGEFKGLTGTSAFERVLISKFDCLKRLPCPTWGTDAAWVTLWQRRTRGNKSKTVLLPCAMCGAESCQRLRFVRYLDYCSAACWKKHANNGLSKHLQLSSVALGSPSPDFADEQAFLVL